MLILDKNNVMVTVLCFMAHMTVVSSNVTFFRMGENTKIENPQNKSNKQTTR